MDAFFVSFEITFTYLPTYTDTRSHKPGNNSRIYRHENPNLSKSNACNNRFSTSVRLQIYAVGKAGL
jgi:hypothetical protein